MMSLLGQRVGQGALVGLLGAAWLASACSNDSSVDFDNGVDDTSVGATSSGGTATSSAGDSGATTSRGAQATGGAGIAGSSAQAGSENTAGTDVGGSNNGGQSNGGSASGGKGGSNATAGAAGKGGMGGTAGGGMAGGGAGGLSGAGTGGGGTGGGGAGSGGTGGGGSCTPQKEVCDGVDNDCDDAIDPPGTCPDGCTGASYGGHAYFFCTGTGTAAAALGKCSGQGMAMVSIESAAENAFVYASVKGTSWLGGSDALKEDVWRWTSTSSVFWNGKAVDGVYNNFLQGQPNDNGMQGGHENCLVIYANSGVIGQNGFWNDLGCDLTLYRAACESTGPVILPTP